MNTVEGSQEGSRESNMEALAVTQERDDAVQPGYSNGVGKDRSQDIVWKG